MICFICGSPLFTHDGEKYVCSDCKRIWKDAGNGDWETIPQPVEILKTPEIGDNYTDIVKPKE